MNFMLSLDDMKLWIFPNTLELLVNLFFNSFSHSRFLADDEQSLYLECILNLSSASRSHLCAIYFKIWMISVHRTSIFIPLPNYEIKRSLPAFSTIQLR